MTGSAGVGGVLALSWFEHRRTRELCAGLDVELALLATRRRGLTRYLLLTARTLVLLLRRRPRVLLVQNPSLILSVLCVWVQPMLGLRVIVDAHNEAVEPYENPHAWMRWLSRRVIRRAHLTIVTNRQLAQKVRQQGGRPFILPDRIPTPPPGGENALAAGFNVVLIATFAKDEPVAAIFDAVRDTTLQMYVTGDVGRLAAVAAANVPPNVHFTGFLEEADYWALLRSADAVVDLTLKADCLVCGAYEALAVGKPLLLSNNAASMELFADGAVFTDNSTADIRVALERLRMEQGPLAAAAVRKRAELRERWQVSAKTLGALISAP